MALVEWTEDYEQYKKGDQFELSGPSLDEYLASGKVKPATKAKIVEKSETASLPKQATVAPKVETATQDTVK